MWQFYSACIYCTLYRVSLSDTEPTECGGTGTWPGRGGGGGGGEGGDKSGQDQVVPVPKSSTAGQMRASLSAAASYSATSAGSSHRPFFRMVSLVLFISAPPVLTMPASSRCNSLRWMKKSQQVHIFSYLDTQSNLIFLSFLQVIFYRFKDTIRYLDSLFAPLRELYDIIIGN